MLQPADNISPKWLLAAKDLANHSSEFARWQKFVDLTEKLPSRDERFPRRVSQSSPAVYKRLLFVVYENLLTQYPFCEQYWCNYANWKAKLGCEAAQPRQIFLKALELMPGSLVVWKSYLEFTVTYETSHDKILDAFEHARKTVGHHYYSHVIYDLYLRFLRSTHKTREYHLLLRQLIEVPIYHYSKYFQEFLTLLEAADLQTIKYFVSEQDLATYYGLEWADLLKKPLKEFKDRLKKQFTDVYITTQYHAYRLWEYEKVLRKPYYVPGQELSRAELNAWNGYLAYLETDALQEVVKDSKSAAAKFRMALVESVYGRCLIRAADYEFFWLKYANLKLSGHKVDEAKGILRKALSTTCKNSSKLLVRLIDLEVLTGEPAKAAKIAVEALKKSPNSLELTLKVIELAHLANPKAVLKMVETKLNEVKGTEFEAQFDYLFREVLSYSDVSLDEIEELFKSHPKKSHNYLRALVDFYKCYKQDEKEYKKAVDLARKYDDQRLLKSIDEV